MQKRTEISRNVIERVEQNGYEKECQYYLSEYYGEKASKEFVYRQVNRLRNCFATQPSGFWEELLNCIYKKGFTEQRLSDAVEHLIETKTSGFLTIAEVIQYDKCGTRLYTFDWIVENGGNNEQSTYNYVPTEIRNKKGEWLYKRVSKEEYERHKVKKFGF